MEYAVNDLGDAVSGMVDEADVPQLDPLVVNASHSMASQLHIRLKQ